MTTAAEKVRLRIAPRPTLNQVTHDEKEIALPPSEWLQRITHAIIDVLHGHRNIVHLRSVVSSKVAFALNLRAGLHSGRTFASTQISGIRCYPLHEGVIEVSASFAQEERSYPVAMRIEQIATGWIVTALEIGPH